MINDITPAAEAPPPAPDPVGSATYSPEDNKLRLYPFRRLERPVYDRVRAAGFIWAPKQELFVAPMWTPDREDLLIELCGEVGDEDKSLVDRAEERADRFENYSERRAEDAERARDGVAAIADGIPLGQPILIGHHSERRARKDAERIENGMRKAVKMWETSRYWEDRARGAIRSAKYKERPDVRARRIKTIEADMRKRQRGIDEAAAALTIWEKVAAIEDPAKQLQTAIHVAGSTPHGDFSMPKKAGDREDWDQRPSPYSVLGESHYPTLYVARTVAEVVERARAVLPGRVQYGARWIVHYQNRIAYERAMLAEDGGTVTDQKGPEVGGAIQCWASPRGGWSPIHKVNRVSVTIHRRFGSGRTFPQTMPLDKIAAIMTKAEVDAARAEGRIVEVSTGDDVGFYVRPKAEATTPEPQPEPVQPVAAPAPAKAKAEEFHAMKTALRTGQAVQVVTAPQLFPTPPDLARRVIALADIRPGHAVLEPSSGTCALLKELPSVRPDGSITAVEINHGLAKLAEPYADRVVARDFLQCNGDIGTFDRVVMNPPFANGIDVVHVRHALNKLKSGGRLVAIVAGGPKQKAALEPLASLWEPLPDDTFKEQGTSVRTVLLVIDKP